MHTYADKTVKLINNALSTSGVRFSVFCSCIFTFMTDCETFTAWPDGNIRARQCRLLAHWLLGLQSCYTTCFRTEQWLLCTGNTTSHDTVIPHTALWVYLVTNCRLPYWRICDLLWDVIIWHLNDITIPAAGMSQCLGCHIFITVFTIKLGNKSNRATMQALKLIIA